jgi:4-hydroxybenzoate polyprenyltransferase
VFKNVPDYDGDLAAGVRTSATVCRSRRSAALAATAATIAAYLSLVALVALRLERTRILIALLWLVPVVVNCVRLVRARDGASGNRVLRTDMLISTAFLASLLLSVAPTAGSAGMVIVGGLVLAASDLLGLDSRRQVDVTREL